MLQSCLISLPPLQFLNFALCSGIICPVCGWLLLLGSLQLYQGLMAYLLKANFSAWARVLWDFCLLLFVTSPVHGAEHLLSYEVLRV